jgi:cellulose synthase/poly-beta-1,6-N-acetylglucosamine synthase-like glycosyltransferase
MIQLLGGLYLLAALGLAVYGLTGFLTLWLYLRHQHDSVPHPGPLQLAGAPPVTLQLPVYNEPLVIERLIDAAVALDYPLDRLQIQVLDDSTDGTTALAAERVAHHQAAGVDIELIHRPARDGFKAGALQVGLLRARGEFIAVFDADFLPQPAFLRQTIPHFLSDPDLGMVQTRWGHLNADYTLLTRAQAISLDKHFAIEQLVRHRADLFPKFNGSAGVWRAECARAAGGWKADTVCEDLDLSTRAQLKGWRFLFLHDVISPAELPPQMTAFKAQQARWAKGSLQCVGKYWRPILASRRHSLLGRAYALISMTGYLAHPLMLGLLVLLPPLLYWGYGFSSLLPWLGLAGLGQPLLFLISQRALYPNWLRRTAAGLPALALVAVGLAPSNSWSIWEAITRRSHEFHRTPKFDLLPAPGSGWTSELAVGAFRVPFSPLILGELGLGLYALLGAMVALGRGSYGSVPFLLLCAAGLCYTAFLSLREVVSSR